MSTDTQENWVVIKKMLDDWKSNPASNYSDKERFFHDWFTELLAQAKQEGKAEGVREERERMAKEAMESGQLLSSYKVPLSELAKPLIATAKRELVEKIKKTMDEYHDDHICIGCAEGLRCDFEIVKNLIASLSPEERSKEG